MSALITPGNLSHLHLLLNHFPTVGLTVAFALLVVSILSDSEAITGDTMRPTALGVLFGIAVVTLPVFTTGLAAQGAIEKLPGISKDAMSAHENAALLAFVVLELTGAVAWWGLWRWRRTHRVPPSATILVFVMSAVSASKILAAEKGTKIGAKCPPILGNF